jgi:hypothetical protein
VLASGGLHHQSLEFFNLMLAMATADNINQQTTTSSTTGRSGAGARSATGTEQRSL